VTRTALAVPIAMDLLTWLVVGLVAGALASAVMGGSGFGLAGDIALGILGALVGSWGFRELGWKAPFAGLSGVITVALLGAIVLLIATRLLRSTLTAGRRR